MMSDIIFLDGKYICIALDKYCTMFFVMNLTMKHLLLSEELTKNIKVSFAAACAQSHLR